MNDKIAKYIEIELTGMSRAKRNQLHLELLENTTRESFAFKDILALFRESEHRDITIRQPFFEKIIYPILIEEISRNNLQAIKLLIKLNKQSVQLKNESFRPSAGDLIDKGLQINADDREMLEICESDSRRYLLYTIHEIPSGVLYGVDGTTEFKCDELLELLKQYEKVCEKLSIDRTELIEECKFHFQNYKNICREIIILLVTESF